MMIKKPQENQGLQGLMRALEGYDEEDKKEEALKRRLESMKRKVHEREEQSAEDKNSTF